MLLHCQNKLNKPLSIPTDKKRYWEHLVGYLSSPPMQTHKKNKAQTTIPVRLQSRIMRLHPTSTAEGWAQISQHCLLPEDGSIPSSRKEEMTFRSPRTKSFCC